MRTPIVGLCLLAFAAPAMAVPQGTTPPALQSQAKQFSIPTGSTDAFMCDGGRIHSVMAVSLYGTVLDVTLLDVEKAPIKPNTWTAAEGFKLADKPLAPVHVTMVFGN